MQQAASAANRVCLHLLLVQWCLFTYLLPGMWSRDFGWCWYFVDCHVYHSALISVCLLFCDIAFALIVVLTTCPVCCRFVQSKTSLPTVRPLSCTFAIDTRVGVGRPTFEPVVLAKRACMWERRGRTERGMQWPARRRTESEDWRGNRKKKKKKVLKMIGNTNRN